MNTTAAHARKIAPPRPLVRATAHAAMPASPHAANAVPRQMPPALAVPSPGDGFDRWLHAQIGHLTASVSPAALLLAYTDWLSHLALSPAKQAELIRKAWRKAYRLALYAARSAQPDAPTCIEPLPQDRRFADDAWRNWPFNWMSQSFLLTQQWWHNATTQVRGVSAHHEEVVTFFTRQLLDMVSPSNFPLTHPQVLQQTVQTLGANLARGWLHWLDDCARLQAGRPPAGAEAFRVGANLAVTRGKVVVRNALAELIQYEPTTSKVHPEPVFILPAWIMKYYVLDLQPQNSLIKYLVDQGHTVFCVSWKNPGDAQRDCGMEDYLRLGLFDMLDVIQAIVPRTQVHAVGYCLGGTLLSMGAAAMARDNDERLATVTLLAAQTDFSEPGEIGLFIDDSEVTFLEDIMFDRGHLTRGQMAGAFQLLRSNDLIWSRGVRDYLMGERTPMSDLMAWNADATRMPYRMHSQYLRSLFLGNDLAAARFRVGGRPVALADLKMPVFCLGTETDHVAPWRSVYKLHLLTDTEITFVLTTGGHNAGVVSAPRPAASRQAPRGGQGNLEAARRFLEGPPARSTRSYRMHTRPHNGKYVDPIDFLAQAPSRAGSWWPAWHEWLAVHSGAPRAAPGLAKPLAALGDAPGTYVLEP